MRRFRHGAYRRGFGFELLAGNHESGGLNGDINDFSACLPNQLPGLIGTYRAAVLRGRAGRRPRRQVGDRISPASLTQAASGRPTTRGRRGTVGQGHDR